MGELRNIDDDTIIVIVIRHIIMISAVMMPHVHDIVFSIREQYNGILSSVCEYESSAQAEKELLFTREKKR